MMPQNLVNRLPDNQHIQQEVQKPSEGDLHTEAGELLSIPKMQIQQVKRPQKSQRKISSPNLGVTHFLYSLLVINIPFK